MQKKFKKSLAVILSLLMIMTMLPMAILPTSAVENLDYNITVEVVDWAVYETSGELIGEFNAVEHGDAFYDVSLTQADDGTFTFSYQIALERNGGNTAWDESSISFRIDSCEDEFLQEFEKSCYSNYNIFYNLKVTRSAGHSFSDWADAGDGTHTRTCSVCSETETQNHSFEGGNCLTVGKCVCGLSSIDSNVHTKPVKYVVNSENNFKHDEVYECCGVINSNLDHKYDSKGMCKECEYQCAHSSFTDSICDFCGYNSDVIVIDGTLGGKTTATEDDVNTLVEQLKGYVDNGITTIIVTGSEPALHNFYGIDTSAVSAALYYLADNNPDSPYCGTIDLILPDVTEIVDDEFNNTFALNSITLPKVTKLGAMAFYATRWLQTITFGSVLTDVNETGGVMFAAVGEDVGGCDLILNCGQMNESGVSAPDLSTNIWKFKHENEFKSITLTHTEGTAATCTAKAVCSVCGESYGEVDADAHSYGDWNSNGDGTHSFTCSICNTDVTESHTMDITTGKCVCGVDMTVIATVTDDTNTYYAADVDTLNEAVTAILEQGSRTFTVELPADAEAEMITAIRRAICDTEGVADGSINLTLKGVTSIPGTTNWDGVAFGPGDIYDEAGKIVDQELVTQLASINLPDVTEIGAQAFYFCENLVTVSAPKAQTIGAQALGYTALTSVEFPELTTIPTDMFSGTWTLSSAKFPKVTTIEQGGLLVGAKFKPENNPTPFPLELTAEGDITFNGSYHFNIASQNYSGKVDLVLNIDKKDQVTFNDDGTATWQVRDDLSYTFKSITFTCTDGTTNHSYTYTDNGDGTHDATCTACGAVVDNDAHTIENHVCTACGAIEITVSFNAGDYKWKTGDQINFVREVEGIGIDDCVFTATVAEDGTVTWTADKPFCWYGEGEQKLFAAPNNGWSVDYFVIPEDQSTSAKLDEADLVNGMWVGTPTTDTVTFNMTHRMAKVTVNYEFAEGVTADISELKVYSIAQICLFSLDDWSIKLTSAGQLDVWVAPYLNGNQFTAFIIPETYATGEDFIKITLSDGTVYEVKMNKAVTFEDGGEYNYKVVITADGAYLTCADECSFEYIANEDGLTHSKVCTECGYVEANENHSLSYSASDNVITESCSKCKATLGTFRIFAPADLYADGTTAKEATVENNLVDTSVAISDITYSAPYGLPPKDAGTYTASVTVGGATATVEFTLLNYAAKVTDKDGNAVGNYKTFAEAVTAAQGSEGSTVTLLDDVTLTEEQNIRSGKFTLDLNGKNLINENSRVLYIFEEVDLTIKDSGETGTLESMNTGSYAIWNYGTLTVESGNIKGAGGIDNKGTLTFKDGTVETVTYSAIYNIGTAYVYDGVLKHAKSFALGNYGTLYVYDGEIDGVSNNGTAYISGGEINCDNYAALNLLGGKLEVTGGSFTGTDFSNGYYSGTPYGEYTVSYNEGATLILKGGEFPNGFVTYKVTANTFLAEGYAFYDKDGYKINVADDTTKIDGYVQVKEHFVACVTDKDGNKIGTYKTFAAAITAAQGSEGSTVTLLDDVTLKELFEINSGKITLDLNGKTISASDGIAVYADLTVFDSATGGKIYGDTFGLLNSGLLTVKGGVINASCAIYNYGTVNVIDGDIQGKITNNGKVTVNGGTLTNINNVNTSHEAVIEINDGIFTSSNTIVNSDGEIIVKGGKYPNGFSVTNDGISNCTLNTILAEDYYYKDADGKLIDVADDAKIINGYVKVSKGADLADAVITLDETQFTYSGMEHKPTVIVTVGGKTLTQGKDYTLTFANNVNAGTATVTIKAIGQAAGGIAGGGENIGNSSNSGDITESVYTGEVTKEFTINKKPVTVTATAPDKVYDGTKDIDYDTIVITFDGIVEGDTVGYTIKEAWFNGIVVGTDWPVPIVYNVTGEDANNYTFPAGGEYIAPDYFVEATADITAKDISDGFIIIGAPLTYNGKEQTQTVEKVIPTGTVPEATYTVSGNKATNVGVYLLTVTGTGNFTGEAKIAYEIALDDECISHLDRVEDNGVMKWNVKSTDRDSLEYVIDQLNNAVTDIADEDKKNEWADTKEACEDMLRIINSIELAIADVEEDYAGFSEDTVKSSDIPALDEIVSKVNEIKDRYGFNLTDEEAKKLEDILDGIEKLKAKIAETAEEIERIDEAVNGYDEETVTSDDVPELGKLIEDIKALTDGDNITEDEKAALEEADKAIDDLVEKLAEVAEESKRVDEAVKSYDEETVKSTDKEDLAQLKEDIQSLIDSGNTTENEKTAFEEMIKDIEGLEDKITETEEKLEEIKDIENVYNPEKVTSDDKAAIEDKIAEIEAVNPDNLTEEQREEYEEIKAGFEALLAEIAAAEKDVADIGAELETFDEERVTKFWEDDIEALKAKLDELLADENMGETEKAKLNKYKAQAEKLIEIINTPKEYFSLRFFYLIWDCLTWKWNGLNNFFESIFGVQAIA